VWTCGLAIFYLPPQTPPPWLPQTHSIALEYLGLESPPRPPYIKNQRMTCGASFVEWRRMWKTKQNKTQHTPTERTQQHTVWKAAQEMTISSITLLITIFSIPFNQQQPSSNNKREGYSGAWYWGASMPSTMGVVCSNVQQNYTKDLINNKYNITSIYSTNFEYKLRV
jgi:hypothetical protein